jgi:hypothetical protein
MDAQNSTLQQPVPQPVEAADTVKELWGVALQPAGCPQCRQTFLVQSSRIGQTCSHCGKGKLEPQPALLRKEPPELMVGFQKGRNDLLPIFNNFVKGVWLHSDDFNPQDLARRAVPVFWPMWLVDSDLSGDWLAEIGYDYKVKSSQESYRDSRWQSRDVIENRIRWEPRTGQFSRHYDNVAAPAFSHQGELLQKIQNYRLNMAVPYKLDWLGQADLWAPDLHPENAWPMAQAAFNQKASEDCQKAASGQHMRSFTIHAAYDRVNWTQLLLPMYVSFYTDDAGQPRLVYINGQNGVAGGARLASQRKGWQMAGIFAGIAVLFLILGGLGLLVTALLPPAGVLGILFILLAFMLGIAGIVPAAWPWQWNRGQQDQKVTRN